MSVRVGINGFGRIGRNVLRAIAEAGRGHLKEGHELDYQPAAFVGWEWQAPAERPEQLDRLAGVSRQELLANAQEDADDAAEMHEVVGILAFDRYAELGHRGGNPSHGGDDERGVFLAHRRCRLPALDEVFAGQARGHEPRS